MGLFDRKEKMNILEMTQFNLEQTQRNLDTIDQLVLTNQGKTDIAVVESEKKRAEDIEPLQAAYALNLCTVSITQIIDYMDLNIMEQEYDMILNNLNLQNMPDDEALLDILKQILNTVTFFKINQKERDFVERDYQQKVKNAVWSAIPNVGALIATGLSKGPAEMAVSIAASVGTAYMSYRKQKAENENAFEREMWKLERSAIEQFDGLKRELFDTAWRLAKHYQFDDKYRLTERQIHQYNAILMDSDSDRKYARLEAIAENFGAYPTFWYQFGHAANLVAIEAHQRLCERMDFLLKLETKWAKDEKNDNLQIVEEITLIKQEISDLSVTERKYREKAKEHFEYYQAVNKFSLLREDKVTSICYLEYVELMLQLGYDNKNILLQKLEDAAKFAGESLEVLQLCIFAYMKLGEASLAEKYLKILVNENYNCVMNAQILSSLYVHQFFMNQNRADARWNYRVLSKRVPSVFLFPMPKEPDADKDELERQFIYIQKFSLIRKYEMTLNELTKKYSTRFNKCIPRVPSVLYNNQSFEDTYENRSRMCEQLIRFVDRDKNDTFRNLLMQEDIFELFTNVLQEYFYKLYELLKDEKNPLSRFDFQCLQEDILSPISHNKDDITGFRLSIQNPDVSQKDIVDALFEKYTFMFFVKEMLSSYTEMLTERVGNLKNMDDICLLETTLLQFCTENELPLPIETYSDKVDDSSLKTNFIFEQLVGGDEYEKLKARNKLREEISTIIVNHCKEENKIIKRKNKSQLYVKGINDNDIIQYLEKIKGYSELKADVLAVIEERGLSEWFNHTDLWFTTEGVAIVKGDKFPSKYTSYTKVKISDDEIVCGNKKYSNPDDVNISSLRNMIVEIGKITGEQDENHDIKDVDFANHCFETIGGEETPLLCLNI